MPYYSDGLSQKQCKLINIACVVGFGQPMSFKEERKEALQKPEWNRGDRHIDDIIRLNETIAYKTSVVITKIASLPHLALGTDEERLMVMICVQVLQNREYENNDHVLLNDLRLMYNDNNSNHRLFSNVAQALGNLERIGLIAVVNAYDGSDSLIKITQIGMKVGSILYEREKETKSLARKDENAIK